MAKLLIYIGITIGGLIGAYIPIMLFNTSTFGWESIVCGALGSLVGLWAGYKITQTIED